MTQSIPEAIQAERLTATLGRAGVLGKAHVTDVAVESSRDTILSRIIRIRLKYSVPTDEAPGSIIFKTCRPDRAGDALHAGRQEVAFYDQIAPSQRPTPSRRNGPCRLQGSNAEQLFERMLASMLLGGTIHVSVSL